MTSSERVRHPHKPECTGTVNGLPCGHDAAGWPRCFDHTEIGLMRVAAQKAAVKLVSASWTLKVFASAEEIPDSVTYVNDNARTGWDREPGRDVWTCVNLWVHEQPTTEELMRRRGPLIASVPLAASPATTPSVPTRREW